MPETHNSATSQVENQQEGGLTSKKFKDNVKADFDARITAFDTIFSAAQIVRFKDESQPAAKVEGEAIKSTLRNIATSCENLLEYDSDLEKKKKEIDGFKQLLDLLDPQDEADELKFIENKIVELEESLREAKIPAKIRAELDNIAVQAAILMGDHHFEKVFHATVGYLPRVVQSYIALSTGTEAKALNAEEHHTQKDNLEFLLRCSQRALDTAEQHL